ncbi:hypothetical protein BC936DRAFT_143528 [Jimgerdemannia flammicorona]|uniref:PHD-type domain-containing protein n=1 Tax=Jimgerdemannia flammicorona TaxID=994334 RepID=A0A433DMG1_9FUNG|nr:hypothetical protein BC936DRAFT_143528 [Jimgerdemannia flammicorona]
MENLEEKGKAERTDIVMFDYDTFTDKTPSRYANSVGVKKERMKINTDRVPKPKGSKKARKNKIVDGRTPGYTNSVIKCICSAGDDDGTMVQCDTCDAWLHLDCIEETMESLGKMYYCPRCRDNSCENDIEQEYIDRSSLHSPTYLGYLESEGSVSISDPNIVLPSSPLPVVPPPSYLDEFEYPLPSPVTAIELQAMFGYDDTISYNSPTSLSFITEINNTPDTNLSISHPPMDDVNFEALFHFDDANTYNI